MKNEIEADGFITPERYMEGSKPIKKKMTGRDVVLAFLSQLNVCDLAGFLSCNSFGFETEIEFEEYLNKEVTE